MTTKRWLLLAAVVQVVTACNAAPNVASHVDGVAGTGLLDTVFGAGRRNTRRRRSRRTEETS